MREIRHFDGLIGFVIFLEINQLYLVVLLGVVLVWIGWIHLRYRL